MSVIFDQIGAFFGFSDSKEFFGVFGCLFCHFFEGQIEQFGKESGGFDGVRWLVATASIGDGRQVGGVGYEHDVVDADGLDDVGDHAVLVGECAAYADEEITQLHGFACLPGIAAVAVQDSPQALDFGGIAVFFIFISKV